MEIMVGIRVCYTPTEIDWVLRYLGRQGKQLKWLMFNKSPHNVSYGSEDDLREHFPDVPLSDKIYKPEYCPTLEELPLEELWGKPNEHLWDHTKYRNS